GNNKKRKARESGQAQSPRAYYRTLCSKQGRAKILSAAKPRSPGCRGAVTAAPQFRETVPATPARIAASSCHAPRPKPPSILESFANSHPTTGDKPHAPG